MDYGLGSGGDQGGCRRNRENGGGIGGSEYPMGLVVKSRSAGAGADGLGTRSVRTSPGIEA